MSANFKIIMVIASVCVLCVRGIDEEYKKPTTLEGKVGGYVLFNCVVEFPNDFPIPYDIYWKKDNNLIFAWYGDNSHSTQHYTGRIKLVNNERGYGKASINLTSVRESDAGWYECRMRYPNRSPQTRNNGSWFHLTVDGGSLMKIPPVNVTVIEYEAAFFHCSVKSPDTTVSWFKDDEPFNEDLISRTVTGPEGLLISPSLMTDLGVYSCKVKNILSQEEETAHAYLNVQYKAKVVYAPEEVFFAFGHQALLDCHFRANPPLKNLRWEKDGFLFDPYNVRDVFYKLNGSLFFSNVNDFHGGKYSCTPYNELGTEGPSSIIKVIIQHPPEFTVKPKSVYISKLGDSVTLHCAAIDRHTDDDRSLIKWSRRDGLALPLNRHHFSGGNLTIENLKAEDRGVYVCNVINEAGRIEADTEIMIETFFPKAPSNLTANSSSTAITVRWTHNSIIHGPDLNFSIWYRPSNNPEWRTHQVKARDKFESTIENLQPSHEYEFMILSQDAFNDGLFSKSYRFRTKAKDYKKPDASAFMQIGAPTNLSVNSKNDGFLVTWDSPHFGTEQLESYILRWYLEPEHKLYGQGETKNNFYLIPQDELAEGVSYSFQVSSLSADNYEAHSLQYEITKPQLAQTLTVTVCAIGILVLLTLAAILFYVKRHLFL